MFETQKIDTFFSGEKNLLDEQEMIFLSRRMKLVRFFKLFLPSLTALLLGLGIVLFDFDANTDSTLLLADEEKLYFEKFRMKNTVFEITEKDNQLSIIKADTVEELTPGEKIYTMTSPNAQTYDKGKLITLVSHDGSFDQNKQTLSLSSDVVAVYDGQMKIKTNSATYNFAEEAGFGNEKVIGNGEKGNFEADRFTFNKKEGIVTLIGNVYMKSNDMELRSPNKATLYINENKFISEQATVNKGRDILKGDVLTAFFKDTKSFEIDKAFSSGHTEIYSEGKKAYADKGEYDATENIIRLVDNVRIVDNKGNTATSDIGIYDISEQTFTLEKNVKISKGTNIITAPKAIYFRTKDEFRFYDDVKVVQDNNTASAQSGVYYIKKNIAELENNVIITKDGNSVRGDKAISDFNTSKSKLIAKNGGRISGKLIEKSLKNAKEK